MGFLEKKCDWLQNELDMKLTIIEVEIVVLKLRVNGMETPPNQEIMIRQGDLEFCKDQPRKEIRGPTEKGERVHSKKRKQWT